LIFLDTAGFGSSIKVASDVHLADRESTEKLLDSLVFSLADRFIVIVGELTWPDQRYINRLRHKIREKEGSNRMLIVIHNLINAKTVEEFNAQWKEQVIENYQNLPNGTSGKQKFPLTRNGRTEYFEYWTSDGVEHFGFMNDTIGRDHNDKVIEVVQKKLFESATKTFRPWRTLEEIGEHLPKYMDIEPRDFVVRAHMIDGYSGFIALTKKDGQPIDSATIRQSSIAWDDTDGDTSDFQPKVELRRDSEGRVLRVYVDILDSEIKRIDRDKVDTEGQRYINIVGERKYICQPAEKTIPPNKRSFGEWERKIMIDVDAERGIRYDYRLMKAKISPGGVLEITIPELMLDPLIPEKAF